MAVFFLVSLLASAVGAICGIGGGVIIKPVLDLLHLETVQAISFLSGCTVLSMSCYSVGRAMLSGERRVSLSTGTPLALGAAVGGLLGSQLFTAVKAMFENPNTVGAVQAAHQSGGAVLLFQYGHQDRRSQQPIHHPLQPAGECAVHPGLWRSPLLPPGRAGADGGRRHRRRDDRTEPEQADGQPGSGQAVYWPDGGYHWHQHLQRHPVCSCLTHTCLQDRGIKSSPRLCCPHNGGLFTFDRAAVFSVISWPSPGPKRTVQSPGPRHPPHWRLLLHRRRPLPPPGRCP